MHSRQPDGTKHFVCVTHKHHYYELRFRPDQRVAAISVIQSWAWLEYISIEQYRHLLQRVLDCTWEYQA